MCKSKLSQNYCYTFKIFHYFYELFFHISNLQTREDFEELKIFRENESIKLGKNYKIGPYIVFIGDLVFEGSSSSNDVNELLLVIHSNIYKVSSNNILEAVDYCFKCATVLKIDFPVECKHIWNFLAERYYKKSVDKVYAVANTLIKKLDILKSQQMEVDQITEL